MTDVSTKYAQAQVELSIAQAHVKMNNLFSTLALVRSEITQIGGAGIDASKTTPEEALMITTKTISSLNKLVAAANEFKESHSRLTNKSAIFRELKTMKGEE